MYYEKYYYTFKGLDGNSNYEAKIFENIPETSYSIYVVTYTNKNYIYVTGDIKIFSIGDTIDGIGSGIPDGAVVIGINLNQKLVYLNHSATISNPPITATLNKTIPTPTEILGDQNPFIVKYSETVIFEPVKGSGAELNLISITNRQFENLYTPDFFKYQVLLTKNDVDIWRGYLDSELYNEPFNSSTNYPVSFTATDGLAILNRILYLDVSGNTYNGLVTQWEIITNILLKLNLSWNKILCSISTTSSSLTIDSGETIFHKTIVRNENYYDEDGKPFSCRKVLEEILRPYGAFLQIINNELIISDLNIWLSTSTTFAQFNADFTYLGTYPYTFLQGDIQTIGFASSDQQLSVESGINKQNIVYSPYRTTELIKFKATEDFFGTGTTTTYGATNYQWSETTYSESESWTSYNNGSFRSMVGIDGENENVSDSYLDILPYGFCFSGDTAQKSFVYKKPIPYLIQNDNYRLKIQLQVYPRLATDLNNDSTATNDQIMRVNLVTRLALGSYKYIWNVGTPKKSGWVLSALYPEDELILKVDNRGTDYENSVNHQGYYAMEDRWTDLKLNVMIPYTSSPNDDKILREDFYVPLKSGARGGSLSFTIFGFSPFNFYGFGVENYVEVQDLRIKDVKITIVDSQNNEINTEDIEYTGYLNPLFKDEGEKITLLSGSNLTDFPIERGALLVNSGTTYFNIKEWTRAGVTDNLESLLLRSIVSNYENPSYKLSARTNLINSIAGYFTYTSQFPDKKFIIVSVEHNYADATSSIYLQEATADNLIITKL